MDLALFDFDGTVTDKETMPDFIYAAVSPGRLRLGKIILLPLILGYKVKLVSGSAIRAALCFFGYWRVYGQCVDCLWRPDRKRGGRVGA
mgnify:CR=1 FL=1